MLVYLAAVVGIGRRQGLLQRYGTDTHRSVVHSKCKLQTLAGSDLELAHGQLYRRAAAEGHIVVVTGAEIYRQALALRLGRYDLARGRNLRLEAEAARHIVLRYGLDDHAGEFESAARNGEFEAGGYGPERKVDALGVGCAVVLDLGARHHYDRSRIAAVDYMLLGRNGHGEAAVVIAVDVGRHGHERDLAGGTPHGSRRTRQLGPHACGIGRKARPLHDIAAESDLLAGLEFHHALVGHGARAHVDQRIVRAGYHTAEHGSAYRVDARLVVLAADHDGGRKQRENKSFHKSEILCVLLGYSFLLPQGGCHSSQPGFWRSARLTCIAS